MLTFEFLSMFLYVYNYVFSVLNVLRADSYHHHIIMYISEAPVQKHRRRGR